jgi:hypothetical protein
LKHPANGIDQNSWELARGHTNLASVILRQGGDLVKAESLTREAHRISMYLEAHGEKESILAISSDLLGRVLLAAEKLGEETKELLEYTLAAQLRSEGLDGARTAICHSNLGNLHLSLVFRQKKAKKRKEQVNLAKSYYSKAVRISTKITGSGHPKTIAYTSGLELYHQQCLVNMTDKEIEESNKSFILQDSREKSRFPHERFYDDLHKHYNFSLIFHSQLMFELFSISVDAFKFDFLSGY